MFSTHKDTLNPSVYRKHKKFKNHKIQPMVTKAVTQMCANGIRDTNSLKTSEAYHVVSAET